jgi:plastocyanin
MRNMLSLIALLLCVSPAYAADATVVQSHTTFDVDEVTVHPGDTVTFANQDDVTHNIQVVNDEGDADDKGLQKPGQDIKIKPLQSGTYKVRCAIHPKMKLKMSVN